MSQNIVTIEGETWVARLTASEHAEWVKYDNAHPWLSQLPYQGVLAMFLSHLRRGINLNVKVSNGVVGL